MSNRKEEEKDDERGKEREIEDERGGRGKR